jgi:hypothetical protein
MRGRGRWRRRCGDTSWGEFLQTRADEFDHFMKTSGEWRDFLFTLAVRGVCGALMGMLVGFLLCAPVGRAGARRPLLVWIFGDESNPNKPYYWFGAWGLIGAAIAMLTTPKWQTPWHERTPINLVRWSNLPPESLDVSDVTTNPGASKKRVAIQIADESGVVRSYSSMDELPPDYREEFDAMEKSASQQGGQDHSISETSQAGDSMVSRTVQRRSFTQYRFMDESGVERVCDSLEEMPPELRDAVIAAKKGSETQR